MKWIEDLDTRVNESVVGKFFQMKERETSFTQELRGASATFLAMAYILAVNPRILADSGGPCVPGEDGGIFGPSYEQCLEELRRQYVTATAIASMIACFIMGFSANLPIALSCGMGMNAYFTYSIVGWRGTGPVPFSSAVTAVLIEGLIFFVLAITGARFFIMKLIPEPIRLATSAGVGCFLAHIGLQTAEGIGVVVGDIATAVTLGGCPPERRTPLVSLTESCRENTDFCIISDNYTCDDLGGVMTSATTWVGLLGFIVITALLSYKKQSAFVVGILFITFISWFRNTAITFFPNNATGDARFEYFSQVASIEPVDKIWFNFSGDLKPAVEALVVFLFIDFLDTSGTLLGIMTSMNLIDKQGEFPKSRMAFASDAVGTIIGSFFSLSPVTSFIETGAGIAAGSRTGLSAVICGFYFFLAIFFAPLISSIPPWATGGTLIIIGALMCRSLKDVKWHDVSHAVTAFITVILMPLTYSIGYALIGGILCWVVLQGIFFVLALLGIEKPNFDEEKPIETAQETSKEVDPPQEKEEFEDNLQKEKAEAHKDAENSAVSVTAKDIESS